MTSRPGVQTHRRLLATFNTRSMFRYMAQQQGAGLFATQSIAAVPLPACWESTRPGSLRQGSEAEGRAAADAPLLAEDCAAMGELLDQHPDIPRKGFTLANYMAAASWLASRGFGVDDVHGAVHCSALLHLTRSCWRLPRMLRWCMFCCRLISECCRFTEFAGRAAR